MCLELSVGCLDLSVGCLDLSFGCLDYCSFNICCPLARPKHAEEKAVIQSAASAASAREAALAADLITA